GHIKVYHWKELGELMTLNGHQTMPIEIKVNNKSQKIGDLSNILDILLIPGCIPILNEYLNAYPEKFTYEVMIKLVSHSKSNIDVINFFLYDGITKQHLLKEEILTYVCVAETALVLVRGHEKLNGETKEHLMYLA